MALVATDLVPMLASFATAYGIVLLTPGPNLLLVLDAACTGSIRVGFAAALGVACGASSLAGLAIVAGAFIAPSAELAVASRIVFGAVVVALGARTLLTAAGRRAVAGDPQTRGRNHFRIAFLTAFVNPLTGLFFLAAVGSLGAASPAACATLCAFVFAAAALWFGAVIVLSSLTLRALGAGAASDVPFARVGRIAAGVALVGFGLRLLGEASGYV